MPTSDNILTKLQEGIAKRESQNNYGAIGKPTATGDRAYGKYQIMGANIPSWTKAALGKELTPQQFLADTRAQDATTSHQLTQLYSKYGNPADVASAWFSGKPIAKAGNAKDVNGTSVPSYVKDVLSFMGGGVADAATTPDSPQLSHEHLVANINAMEQQGASQEEVQSYLDSLKGGQDKPSASSQAPVQPLQQGQPASTPTVSGDLPTTKLNIPEGMATDSADKGLSTQDAQSYISPSLRMGTANAPTQQEGSDFLKGSLQGAAQALPADVFAEMQKMTGEKEKPLGGTTAEERTAAINAPSQSGSQMTGKIGGVLATASIPAGEAKAGASAAKGVISKALTGPKDAVVDAVSPRLIPSVAEKTKTTTQGLLKKVVPVATKKLQQVADAVRPYFDAGATWSKNAETAYKAIEEKAQQLDGALRTRNIPYIFRELKSDFKNIEIPHFIKTSDALAQKRAQSIINKFMEIAKSKDGTLHSLLDARKEFDVWVEKEYPRVFDESGNAVNQLVSNVRHAANDFIAERAPDVAVKKALKDQSLLFDAHDTFLEKSALGEKQTAGEIGTTAPGRFKARHPGLMKIGSGAATVLGGIAGYNEAKKLPLVGGFIP